uniref:Uncharacterized protein n=1 Tax=Anguilla anguilla TaxID=7936 RepID=A0A0E9PRN6_ANGAN
MLTPNHFRKGFVSHVCPGQSCTIIEWYMVPQEPPVLVNLALSVKKIQL